jgi:hypothetical protein
MLGDPNDPAGVGLEIRDSGVEVVADCFEEGEKLAGVSRKPDIGKPGWLHAGKEIRTQMEA